ncbi:S8 family serine peptidase [Nonomuraea sp. NPDC050556]|uniref:S8 family serine peptidase n=1 Tax=Nonomuraea sp. NPDC050556 TaxID=3364369 RepID=UPI0037A9AA72
MQTLITALLVAGTLAVPQGAPPVSGRSVTLITGDTVTVTSGGAVVKAGPGRQDVFFSTDEGRGRLRVIPSDAFPLLRAGRLDPRLFDVTTLLEFGYDDAHRDTLPLLVTGSAGFAKGTALPAMGGSAVREEKKDAAAFWKGIQAGGGKIWLDGLRKPQLDRSTKQIGAPAAWQRGQTGAGVKVAVLDSGIDATHPDLTGKVAAKAVFTEGGDGRDVAGHGTHVAATIAGAHGVAPGATLLDGKVCAGWCPESALLAGMQWAVDQGARVVNMSVSGPDSPGLDPLEQAIQTLTERHGTLFVVAAGNMGEERTVGSPASADAALAVGAVDRQDRPAAFSSRGPRVGDSGLKPEITAPGVQIVAARSKDSPGTGTHVAFSGTSMATPHVAGVAALVAGMHQDWTAERLKAVLMGSAAPAADVNVFTQGAGRVDADRATTQQLTAQPPVLSFGMRSWPHQDDKPETKTIVYTNPLAEPVTLELTGPFEISPRTLRVPAGGQAGASVTVDTRTGPDGLLGGQVVATGPGVRVVTPVGVDKERESYDLTLDLVGRDGKKASMYFFSLFRLDAHEPEIWWEDAEGTGSLTLRLPKGRWMVRAHIVGDDGVAQLLHPGLDLDRAQTLTLDARTAKPIDLRPPRADAVQLAGEVAFRFKASDGLLYSSGFVGYAFERMFTAQAGPDRAYPDTLTKVAGDWSAPGAVYRLAYLRPGGMVTGFSRNVKQRELAEVRGDYAQATPGHELKAAAHAQPKDGYMFSSLEPYTFAAPYEMKEYLNVDDGIRWQHVLWDEDIMYTSGYATYRAGRTVTERWNRGVFAPSGAGLERDGDVLSADLPLYTDGAGRTGYPRTADVRMTLYRDGGQVGEATTPRADFLVPQQGADYRLVVDARRPGPLSTRTHTVWTFRSEQGQGAVRLADVRFSPALDATNTAPAGRLFPVPVSASRLESVEVSFDDGVTWRRVLVAGGKALVDHPKGEGWVSLRATADGVEQTVIRAYRIA